HTFQLAVADWIKENKLESASTSSTAGTREVELFNSQQDSSDENSENEDDPDPPSSKPTGNELSALSKLKCCVKKLRTKGMKMELKRVGIQHRIPLQNCTR
ncbi:hypothetical protein U1Q18_051138, partial [Sarracenia purpurea var. burkii]